MDYARFFGLDEEKYSMEIHPEWAQLKKETGYEAQQSPLLYVFVTVFSLHRAQTTIAFEFCMSN